MMCGIVGIYNKLGITSEDLEEFTEMLVKCEKRGKHATGVYNQHLNFVKGALASHLLVQSKGYKRWREKSIGAKWAVGHCRFATSGDPKHNVNNHPVYYGESPRFLLVHNGSVRCLEFPVPYGIVDTMSAWLAIDECFNGNNLLLSSAFGLSFMTGAGIFVAGSKKQLVISKLSGRPLCVREDGGRACFASEREIIAGDARNARDFPEMTALCIDVNGKKSEMKVVSRSYGERDEIRIRKPPEFKMIEVIKPEKVIDAKQLSVPSMPATFYSPFRRLSDGYEKCRFCSNYNALDNWCEEHGMYVFPGMSSEENEDCHFEESPGRLGYWGREEYDRIKKTIEKDEDKEKNEK